MHYRVIQDAIKAQPFAPFDVVMSSGDRYRIARPENLTILKDCVLIPIYPKRSTTSEVLAERYVSASYLHISALERVSQSRASKK